MRRSLYDMRVQEKGAQNRTISRVERVFFPLPILLLPLIYKILPRLGDLTLVAYNNHGRDQKNSSLCLSKQNRQVPQSLQNRMQRISLHLFPRPLRIPVPQNLTENKANRGKDQSPYLPHFKAVHLYK